jgi:hypothetical protein
MHLMISSDIISVIYMVIWFWKKRHAKASKGRVEPQVTEKLVNARIDSWQTLAGTMLCLAGAHHNSSIFHDVTTLDNIVTYYFRQPYVFILVICRC